MLDLLSLTGIFGEHHHHHQVPDLEQTLATMPLQTSLSSDKFKKFKPLLCPPVAELQRLSRNVIRCLPLSRLPSTLPVKDKNSKPLRLHTCPKNSICLFLIFSLSGNIRGVKPLYENTMNVLSPIIDGCYAENAICYINGVITTVKGFQGRSKRIANIIKAMLSAQVCARGRDWL